MFRFKKKEKIEIPLEVPKHIGIIMDGNGRWAKKRMQPRVFGHKAGMEALQEVTIAAKKYGGSGLDCLCLFYGKLDTP
ncbi:Undecaprenyl pyrophosphate synthetase [Streptococcus parasanguinis]|nr:Undecaprenyl pyrophosphate synthetase [Streptococcus parasanguinis]